MPRFPTDPDHARFAVLATIWQAAPARRARKARPRVEDPDPTSLTVSVEVAATLLDSGETTVWRLVRERKLTKARTPGKRTRVTRASVEALMRAAVPVERPKVRRPRAPTAAPTVETDPERLRASLVASRARLFGKS